MGRIGVQDARHTIGVTSRRGRGEEEAGIGNETRTERPERERERNRETVKGREGRKAQRRNKKRLMIDLVRKEVVTRGVDEELVRGCSHLQSCQHRSCGA